MVQLVEQMLGLQKQLPETRTGHDQTHLQRQIDATDRQCEEEMKNDLSQRQYDDSASVL